MVKAKRSKYASGKPDAVRRPERQKLLVAAVAFAAACAITAVVLDIGYALVWLGAARANYWLDRAHIAREYSQADRELGFIRKPNVSWKGRSRPGGPPVTYRSDANGFRNSHTPARAGIVFVGDSYTEAGQVEESRTFAAIAPSLIGMTGVNLGIGAYGPSQEAAVVGRYALDFKPSFLVWQFFDGNDLSDAEEFAFWRSGQTTDLPLARRYLHASLLARVFRSATRSFGATVAVLQPSGLRVHPRYPYSPSMSVVGESELRRALTVTVRLCRERAIEMAVLRVPTMLRAAGDRVRFETSEAARRFRGENNPDAAADTLRRVCAELGIPVLDALPVFSRAFTAGDVPYIPDDEHLSERGHELVADLIAGWIRRQGDHATVTALR